jgi:SH3-like domain-containing protein
MPRYSHGKALQKSITAVVFYECLRSGSGDSSDIASTKPVSPTEAGTYVRVPVTVEAGLRLRSAPTTASQTVAIEPPGASLRVSEPADVALPKLGVYDQWIKVRDGQGREGYVAAWYVQSGPTIGDMEEPEPTPEPPVEPAPVPVEPVSSSEVEPVSIPVPEPPVPAAETLTVYVSEDAAAGLRLRSAPNTSSSTLKILPANTALTLLEGSAEMVGAQKAWLKVREPKGTEGYVAAWYVRK